MPASLGHQRWLDNGMRKRRFPGPTGGPRGKRGRIPPERWNYKIRKSLIKADGKLNSCSFEIALLLECCEIVDVCPWTKLITKKADVDFQCPWGNKVMQLESFIVHQSRPKCVYMVLTKRPLVVIKTSSGLHKNLLCCFMNFGIVQKGLVYLYFSVGF